MVCSEKAKIFVNVCSFWQFGRKWYVLVVFGNVFPISIETPNCTCNLKDLAMEYPIFVNVMCDSIYVYY